PSQSLSYRPLVSCAGAVETPDWTTKAALRALVSNAQALHRCLWPQPLRNFLVGTEAFFCDYSFLVCRRDTNHDKAARDVRCIQNLRRSGLYWRLGLPHPASADTKPSERVRPPLATAQDQQIHRRPLTAERQQTKRETFSSSHRVRYERATEWFAAC